MQSPELAASVMAPAMVPASMQTDEFTALVRSDHAFWGQVIRELGVTANS